FLGEWCNRHVKRTATFSPLDDASKGASHRTVTVPPRIGEDTHTVGSIKAAGAGDQPAAFSPPATQVDSRVSTTTVESFDSINTPPVSASRKRGKCMSRRSGQNP